VGTSALYDLNITANDGSGANTAIGYNTGRGIIIGVNNTIIGANVTGLASGLSGVVIIADGAGNQRIYVNASGNVGIGTTLAGAGVTYKTLNINGSQLFVGADSTQESPMTQIDPSYVVNTHASYTTRTVFSQWKAGGALEIMRLESGASAMIGFYGHAAAVQPTVTGLKGGNAALGSLLTALAGMGLVIDSSGV
jgi:uncharacterized glyoxalase superfamily protein PhnB